MVLSLVRVTTYEIAIQVSSVKLLFIDSGDTSRTLTISPRRVLGYLQSKRRTHRPEPDVKQHRVRSTPHSSPHFDVEMLHFCV